MSDAIRIPLSEEVKLLQWLSMKFGFPPDLPIGYTTDIEPVIPSVVFFISFGFSIVDTADAKHHSVKDDVVLGTYRWELKRLTDNRRDPSIIRSRPAYLKRAEKILSAAPQHEDVILRVATGIWELLPKIHECYAGEYSTTKTPHEFFAGFVQGLVAR